MRNSAAAVTTGAHPGGAALPPTAPCRLDVGLVRTVGVDRRRRAVQAGLAAGARGEPVTGSLAG